MSDPYEVLGIQPGATPDDVRAAYRRLVDDLDPARLSGRPLTERIAAERRSKEIAAAYRALVGSLPPAADAADLEAARESDAMASRAAEADDARERWRAEAEVRHAADAARLEALTAARREGWKTLAGLSALGTAIYGLALGVGTLLEDLVR